MIMPGVTVGENAVLGAHSFVNRDVPENATVIGVPAKSLTQRREDKKQIMTENGIGKIVVDAIIAVHRALGLGLPVPTYSDSSPQRRKGRRGRNILFPFCWEDRKEKITF